MAEAARFKDVLSVQLDRLQCILKDAHDNRVASLEQEVATLRAENARLCEHISGFAAPRTPSPIRIADNFGPSLSESDRDRHAIAEAMVRQPSNCTSSHTPESARSRPHSPISEARMLLRAPGNVDNGSRTASPHCQSPVSSYGLPMPPAPLGEPALLSTSEVEEVATKLQEVSMKDEDSESLSSTMHWNSGSQEDAFGALRNRDMPPVIHDAPDLLRIRSSLAVPGAVGGPCSAEVLGWQTGAEGVTQKPARHSMGSRRGSNNPSPRVSFTQNCIETHLLRDRREGRTSLGSRSSAVSVFDPVVSRVSTMSKSSFVSNISKRHIKAHHSLNSRFSHDSQEEDNWGVPRGQHSILKKGYSLCSHFSGLNQKLANLANERNSSLSEFKGPVGAISRNTTRDALHSEPGQLERAHTTGTLATLGTEARRHLEDGFVFEVWPVWTKKSQLSRMSVLTHYGKSKANMDDDDLDLDSDHDASEWARWLMVHPSSLKRLFWDYSGFILLIYDFGVVPLELFDLPKVVTLQVMAMVSLVYWTLDFVWSFFTGYRRTDGSVVMQHCRVAKRYIGTWMFFDIVLLLCQWLDLFIEGGGLLKLGRVLRILRLARLARVRRNSEVARAVAYWLQSERLALSFSIVRLMSFLIGIAHCIACCWYGIGSSYHPDGDSWVAKHELERQKLSVQYATALHWSLTQFTGSTETDIHPENLKERIFTVGALLLGFLVSASVVSSITCSLTRLQIINATQATQLNNLKRYLFDNNISTKVALRVQRNAMYALDQQIRNSSEENIELLRLISEPQRIELHYEIHKGVLCTHKFFQCYDQVNRAALKRVTHSCIHRLHVSDGDVLFSEGEIPREPIVYFLLDGKLRYMQDKYVVKTLTAGTWACGALLWTPWVHLGVLRALSECKILLLDATQFQSIAALFQTAEFYPRKYAEELVKQLNLIDKTELTDIQDAGADVRLICEKVFPQHLRPSDDTSSSPQTKGSALLSRTMTRLFDTMGRRSDNSGRSDF